MPMNYSDDVRCDSCIFWKRDVREPMCGQCFFFPRETLKHDNEYCGQWRDKWGRKFDDFATLL